MPRGAIANLSAALRWNLGDFDRGTGHIEGTFLRLRDFIGGVADAIETAGRRMTLGITVPLAGLAVYTVKAASDVVELQSAFDATFAEMAASMNVWAEETGDAMGRATSEMQEGALALGGLFNQAADTDVAAGRLSQRFTELAQDASSFFNVPFDEALQKIRSGLSGEAEPLRRFNIFLNAAVVNAKALEMGLVAEGQELSENAKIMARAALIAEGLSQAQGDVERTSGTLTNRVRALRANLQELAVEIGQRLMPIAERLVGWAQRAVAWFAALPDGMKDAILKMALFAAAMGPVLLVLKAIAVVALPLLLANLGPVAAAVSFLINPLGTLLVVAGKLALSAEFMGAAFARIAPVLLRFLGPVGLAIAAIVTFKDEIGAAFQAVFKLAEKYLGPKLEELFAVFGRLGAALDALAVGPIGRLVAVLRDLLGEALQRTLEQFLSVFVFIAGVVIDAVTIIVATIERLVSGIDHQFRAIGALLTGNWSDAWAHAKAAVGDTIMAIAEWLSWISPQLTNFLNLIGRALGGGQSNAPLATSPFGRGGGQAAEDEELDFSAGGSVLAPSVSSGGRSGRGKTGPSAAELAARREVLRLDQEIAVTRERGDLDALRALERQRDLRERITRYQRAGLDLAQATAAAEADMAEMDQVRAEARMQALADHEAQFEMELATLRNDHLHIADLEEERFLKERTLHFQQMTYDLVQAERLAQEDLLLLEEARADNMQRRLADQRAAHEIELGRLRGDDTSGLEENARISARVDELQGEFGRTRIEAEAEAMREASDRSRAHLQGTFRDTFSAGLKAAMNGNLGGFFENWLQDRSFNALSRVLDRLADSLANLVSGGGGGGGLFDILGSVLGIASGGAAKKGLSGPSKGVSLPKFANSGSFKIKGFAGIDQNTLSLNGNPIAQVSSGEIMDIKQGADETGGGRGRVDVFVHPSGEFDVRVAGTAARVVRSAASEIVATSVEQTLGVIERPGL